MSNRGPERTESATRTTHDERLDKPRHSDRNHPYPVVIREARYGSGVYAGAQWTLVAGLHHPDANTEAWGSDSQCNEFWADRAHEGPEFVAEEYSMEKEAFAVARGTPNECVIALREHYDDE